jgi:ADP-ribose pyrophosphatase YjhB (NUDIX family)
VGFKPSDFFVGVIDFFAVILPGAIVVYFIDPRIPGSIVGSDGFIPRPTGTAERWIVFMGAAYLTGHFLFLLGASLDNAFYDAFRRALVPKNKDSLWRSITNMKKEYLGSASGALNAFQWARSALRLAALDALIEVERYEADSKFFRSLSMMLIGILLALLVPGTGAHCVRSDCTSGGSIVGLLSVIALAAVFAIGNFQYQRLDDAAKERRAGKQWSPLAFWVLVVAATLALILSIVVGSNWRALIVLALVFLSLWRYGEQRWKSTKVCYQYILSLATLPPQLRRADRPSGLQGSAGAREAGAVAFAQRGGERQILLVSAREHPKCWIFPKGHIECGETAAITAVRELREEAGVIGRPVASIGTLQFASNGEQVSVEYFLVEARGQTDPDDDRDVIWCTVKDALQLLTYGDSRELLKRALPLIS